MKNKIKHLYGLEEKGEIESFLFKTICKDLDKLLNSTETNDILDGIDLINSVIEYLKNKNLMDLYGIFCSIYLLDEKYNELFYESENEILMYNLELFYSDRGFFEDYIKILKKMGNIVTKNNLIENIILRFDAISYEMRKYIQYLKDNGRFLKLVENEILEYEIFREIFSPYVKKNLENIEEDKINKILSFFEKMAVSPDDYVWVLLRDTVIEGGWLEVGDNFEDIIKKFGDNFLKLYALVYDGRVFIRNKKIWAEVKRRGMKI